MTALDQPTWENNGSQREARRRQGKAVRKTCPRSSHANLGTALSSRDPLDLIEQSNADRLQKLLPIRFGRMAESPFAFFRGTAVLQAYDLAGTPSAGLIVQCCGDCHLMNFGGFATPERFLIFDINDFDETLPGPFEWDLKRLATSFVLAARWFEFERAEAKHAAQAVANAYRNAQSRYAGLSVLETWYSKIEFGQLIREAAADLAVTVKIKEAMAKANRNTPEHVFHKITTFAGGKPRIADQPPLLFHGDSPQSSIGLDMGRFLQNYRHTLPVDRQVLFDRYRFVDAAHKVVGVGSVGTRCYIVLFVDRQDDHLFLQVKEARSSVLEGRAGPSPFANQGERVVTGQRLMQSASDIFLGWSSEPDGRDFYVRQLHDMKLASSLAGYTPRLLIAHARLCGEALARAHAKSGDATMIAGYLGTSDSFDVAIRDHALGYADQVEKDYELFQRAVQAGRFPVEKFQA
jgi:uncharacterized protein (DUF2252 family)